MAVARDQLLKQLEEKFCEIGRRLGYLELSVDDHPSCTSMILSGEHGLHMHIDWRDYYLEVALLRRVRGELIPFGQDPQKRLCQIPLWYVYGVESPAGCVEFSRTEAYLLRCLDYYCMMIEAYPQTLIDFAADMEENTSREKTVAFYAGIEKYRLQRLEEDRQAGRLTGEMYEFLMQGLREQFRPLLQEPDAEE